MMNPSGYKKIAVASTFSPRFEQVLSEAGRIRKRFGSTLSLIYIGERTDETTKKFQNILGRFRLPSDSPVHYGQGDPADGILRAIAENNVDLIVAGHTHRRVNTVVNGIPVVEAGASGGTIAVVDFVRAGSRGREVHARLETPFADRVTPGADVTLVFMQGGRQLKEVHLPYRNDIERNEKSK